MKIGDVYFRMINGKPISKAEVVRVTKTQLVLSDNTKLRINGDSASSRPVGSDTWSQVYYYPYSDERECEYRRLKVKGFLINTLTTDFINNLDDKKLKIMINTVREIKNATQQEEKSS